MCIRDRVQPRRRGPRPTGRPGHAARRGRLRGHLVRGHGRGRHAAGGRTGRRGPPRSRPRGEWGAARRRRGDRPPVDRLHPPGLPRGRAVRIRHHRPAHAPPAGPAEGPGHRRLLRRSGGGKFRGPPAARRGPLRRRHLAVDGRDDARLPDPAVPGQRSAVPPGRPDRGDHGLQRGGDPHAVENGRGGLAAHPGQGARGGQ